jgi:fibronectin type 3 domain-containing protein
MEPTSGREKMKKLAVFQIVAVLLGAMVAPGRAFVHPCIPSTLQELDTIKANLDKEPWKTGFAILAADGKSQLTYLPNGPFAEVKRSPNLHLGEWSNDMAAVWNLARMWYFTGNEAYAQKAHDILISWATTQTLMGGDQAGLALGDLAMAYGGGASILRGTWPGWTQQDTLTVKNYFLNVLWPGCAANIKIIGPANKGDLNLMAGIAIATFCDDTDKFNFIIDTYRTYPGAGLPNILPTGEMGETGRDAGHAYGGLLGKAFVAEVAWKQGIDLFSEGDNRLLACAEYYCRNIFETDNPFVDYGTVDALYVDNAEGPYGANRAALYIIQNAYKNRKGLPTPWIDRKLPEQIVDSYNWMFARPADFTTATPPAPIVRPEVSLASSGLILTTLGNNSAGRSLSYSNGVWTMTGAGTDVWADTNDDGQFACKQMTGDCAIVARVTSSQSINGATKAGVMIRDNLSAAVSQRGYAAMIPNATNQVQSRLAGATLIWAGRVLQTTDLPSGIPYWVKIERRGSIITAYSSPDGTSWSPNVSSEFGNLPSTVYIGLFIASGSSTTTTTATFDHVAFTGGTGGLVTTPAAPAALLASGSAKAITLRWLPSFGATGYDVLRSTTSGSGYAAIASDLPADKPSYADTTAAAGTTYYYVVQAKNSAGTSGNSPQFYGTLLSTPMVNLAFGGTATASFNGNSTTEGAIKAFDSDPGSKWYGYNSPANWLQYDFGAGNAQVVKRYTISAADVAERDPKDWTFLGSQDGATWTTLDSQSGRLFANRTQQNTYAIANTTAYRYYRLDITANNGAGGVALSELGLWSDTGRTIPDGTCVIASRNSNKPMDVTGPANGAPVVQQTFAGDDTQQWTLAWQGNGQYRATNVAAAKVLDNGGTSTADANLVIQPSTGGTSQLWNLVPDADGFFRIESADSGLVANVSGGSTTDGANIVQSTYSGANSQQWRIGVTPAPQPVPAAPTALSGTPISISQINLSWTGSSGALSYQVKRSTTSGGPYTPVSVPVNTTSYSDTTGLLSSTTYYYVVSAINGSGESAGSAQAQATTLTGPPSAPTDLTAILGTNRAILSWTATGGATSYTVKRASTRGGPYTILATGLTGTTFTDTTFTHDIAYYYVVVATNADGTSDNSTEVHLGPGTLVVQLGFDETSGTTAADSSGGGHDATLVNGAGLAPGFLDNALTLPATSAQYATLPDGIVSGLSDFTLATWVRIDAFTTWARIFDFGTGTGTNMFLAAQGPAGAGRPRFSIRTPSGGEQNIDSSIALTAGAWTHVAVTRSGNTVSVYLNGTLAGSGTTTLSPADLGFTTRNYLGKSQFSDPYLNGALDDFRLYAHAMNSTEITALAHPPVGTPRQLTADQGNTQATLTWFPDATLTYTVKRATTSGGPYTTVASGITATTYTDTGLTNGTTYYYVVSGANGTDTGPDSAAVSVTPSTLRLHLKFDESSGATTADSSGRGSNATLVGGPTFAAGRIGNALGFAAASSQYATLPSGIVSSLDDFTISTWVKVNAFATWQRIFDFGTGTNNYMFLTTQYGTGGNAAKLRFGIRTPAVTEQNVSSTVALVAGSWTHVAVTRSGTTVSLYVNGALAGSGTLTLGPGDLGTTTQNYLGKSQFNDPYLSGALDDLRIYSRALNAAEITSLAAGQLAAPQNLSATPGTSTITLSWSAVSGASGYTVRRAAASGGPYADLAVAIPAATYADSGLADGGTWYYTVVAVGFSGEGTSSNPVSATTYTAVQNWRLTHFGSITNSGNAADSADPDGDGLPNTQEFAAGTDPNSAASALRVNSVEISGGDAVVSFPTVLGKTYRLERSDTLQSGSWTTVQDHIAGTDGVVQITDAGAAAQSKLFYRLILP